MGKIPYREKNMSCKAVTLLGNLAAKFCIHQSTISLPEEVRLRKKSCVAR